MELEEDKKEKGVPAPVHLDSHLQVILDPSSLWKPPNPDLFLQHIHYPAGPLTQVRPDSVGGRRVPDQSRVAGYEKPQSDFEAQIVAWMEEADEPEDSESVDLPLYEPTSKAHPCDAEIPTFSPRDQAESYGLEEDKDSNSLQSATIPFPPMLKSIEVSPPTLVCEKPQDLSTISAKAGPHSAEFILKAGESVDIKASTESWPEAGTSLLSQSSSDAHSSSKLSPVTIISIVERVAPPTDVSATSRFRRQKFRKKREDRTIPIDELLESERDAPVGKGKVETEHRDQYIGQDKDSQGEYKGLLVPTEPDTVQLSAALQTALVSAPPSVQPLDSPVSDITPAFPKPPIQLRREFESSMESLVCSHNPTLKDVSDSEGDGACSKSARENTQLIVSAGLQLQDEQSEGHRRKGEMTQGSVEMKVEGLIEEDMKHPWVEQDTSMMLLIDDSSPPVSASTSFPKPSNAPEDLQSLIYPQQPLITYSEIWPQFQQIDLQAYLEPAISQKPQKTSCLTRCFRSVPIELEDGLNEEVSRIYALTHMGYNESELHRQVLMNVWKFLVISKKDCERYGRHWEKVGFQGADPARELGKVGIFGLLQLLFLACNLPDEADAILTYSRHPYSSFPFAVISLRISAIAIETLRTGKLDKLIAKRGEAYRTVRTK